MKQSEHVLYITLIDFLLQLLFLGLVIGVIYAITQQQEVDKFDPIKGKEAQEEIEKIRKATGISDITELTDELTRLGPLRPAIENASTGKDMTPDVNSVGGVDKAREILKKYAKAAGQGKPSCLPNSEILADFNAYGDHIEIRRSTEQLKKLLLELKLEESKVASLSLSSFNSTFKPVAAIHPDCIYNVKIFEFSYDTRPRDAFYPMFRPSIIRHTGG